MEPNNDFWVVLDNRFEQIQNLIDSRKYADASDELENLKRYVRSVQRKGAGWVVNGGTGLGIVGGLAFPGVGNIVGGVVGGFIGRLLGKHFAGAALYCGGTIESIIELAGAGRREMSYLTENGTSKASQFIPNASILERWKELRRKLK